ncbi:Apoptosis-inducing factor B [Grifola frondosa]|uniref:Apoptosis-inducing factor B n=1 Tax=Grifola frondosa TaxID=5627 RepID=A0A1C7M8J7_GRIFR|nr:Apoptosis-inducing factor B [Grifola frondosa]
MSPLLKTIAVLGASYGGARAAQVLAQSLPKGWRVVLVDRNSHMNHLYVLPRYAVLQGHEHKAFIPYTHVFPAAKEDAEPSPHIILHAQVTSLSPHSLTLSRAFPEHGIEGSTPTLDFEYLVYALGSHLPAPIDLWGPVADEPVIETASVKQRKEVETCGRPTVPQTATSAPKQGTKPEAIQWLKRFQTRIDSVSSVLVVGGGALGIQYATDIAEIYPAKRVTLLHSRSALLPRFDQSMHVEIMSALAALNVNTILGDRLDLSSLSPRKTVRIGTSGKEERVVRTEGGREVRAELVLLCTGQKPNTELLASFIPDAIVSEGPSKGMVHVKRTMQVAVPVPESEQALLTPESADEAEEDPTLRVPYPHVFAIGDAADAFGAINAGHNAYFQGEVAARNIIKLIRRAEVKADNVPVESVPSPATIEALDSETDTDTDTESLELERYVPGPPAIKVSLGLTKSVYQIQGVVGTRDSDSADLDAHLMWRYFGMEVDSSDAQLYA